MTNPFLDAQESTDSSRNDNTPNILDLFGVQAPPQTMVTICKHLHLVTITVTVTVTATIFGNRGVNFIKDVYGVHFAML